MLSIVPVLRRHLNLEFTARRGVRVRIVERPGRWMDAAEQGELLDELRRVSRESLGVSVNYSVLTGEPAAWQNAIITLLYEPGNRRLIAFNALLIMECSLRGKPVDVIHLGMSVVQHEWRSKGLSSVLYGWTCLLLYARRQFRPLWIGNVTQVPSVFGMVGEQFSDVFPDGRTGTRRSFDHLVLARQIMLRYRSGFGAAPEAMFDENRFVIVNAYTGPCAPFKGTFAGAPKHRYDHYNETCRREIDYDRGDDFLQLGRLDLRVIRQQIRRSREGVRLRILLTQLSLLFLGSILAPILRWFSPREQLGDLRPWTS